MPQHRSSIPRRGRFLPTGTIILVALTMVGAGSWYPRPAMSSTAPTHASMQATTLPVPPAPPGCSPEALVARAYVSEQQGIPAADLVVVNEFRRESALLGRSFQAVTLLDQPSGRFFEVLVDPRSRQVEERAAIEAAEDQAFRAHYGKLQPALHERLQAIQDEEEVEVTIWAATEPANSLAQAQTAAFAALATRYPEAAAAMARGGKPMEVEDRQLAERIYQEYVERLDAGAALRIQPLVEALEKQGVRVRTAPGLPAVTATLSKDLIVKMARRHDVGVIYLAEGGQRQLALDSAVPTARAPAVWARGYDGNSSVKVAILEDDNVDFGSNTSACPAGSNNCFRHPGPILATFIGDHATLVGSAAASAHSSCRGMAPDVTVISAGIQGPDRQNDIDALVWALDQGSLVVNASYCWCTGSSQMDVIDQAFDHYARARLRMLVVAAGNNDAGCPYSHVTSPAKGWNVLAVGAFDDRGDPDWSNDVMAAWSCYENPASSNEKPEVVAPGVGIRGIAVDGRLRTEAGTSFAAPQVAGLAALLIDRNWTLNSWPEAGRAIIMASATHNIAGPSGIPTGQDLRDGAGGINADLADLVAQTRKWEGESCEEGSCWWGAHIDPTTWPAGTLHYWDFSAGRWDRARVAIAWWSNPDCPSTGSCQYDRLDTDLQMGVQYWNGSAWGWVPGAWSASWGNSHELVEFVAPGSGSYRIAIYNQRSSESLNFVGIALARQALPHHIFLPIVVRGQAR